MVQVSGFFRRLLSGLAFQSLAPGLFLLLTFTSVAGVFAHDLIVTFSNLQSRVNKSNEASESLLRLGNFRSRIRETLLVLQATGNRQLIPQLQALEVESARERNHLRRLIEGHGSQPGHLDRFFAGAVESEALRKRAFEALRMNRADVGGRLIDSYLVLYRINSARLQDLHQFLSFTISHQQADLALLLEHLPYYILLLFVLEAFLAVTMLSVYKGSVLTPLKDIARGMGEVARGRLEVKVDEEKGPREIREMAHNFNSMTSILNQTREELIDARSRAERSAKAKADFLSNMSHEIRTPLNVIVGVSEVLTERAGARPGHEVSLLAKSARLLMNLINDILDYSRLESGHVKLNPAPFDLRGMFEEGRLVFAALAHKKTCPYGWISIRIFLLMWWAMRRVCSRFF